MFKCVINIKHYWKVIVYYNIDYNFFHIISKDLKENGCSNRAIDDIYKTMNFKNGKAVTVSNIGKHKSVVLFNYHFSYNDYLNSIIHEAEHVKQSMLKAYNIEDKGEPPAYTVGYIGMKMLIPMM